LTHITWHGELCVASRYPIHTIRIISEGLAIRYTIDTPAGPVDLIGVHLSSPHWALRDSIDGADQGPEELARNIRQRGEEAVLLKSEIEQTTNHPLIIAGDFNLTPDSPLFTENFSTMSDAYQSTEFGFGWSYFHQHTMVRIDHVLTNGLIVSRSCVVGPALGSPHRPLVVDLILPGQKG
jgi:endonuclease/exonuclease/phosphatase family metal-dependent hydrolase